ncbi:MAG: hypothetical protein WEC99_09595 [Halofilum sp. (in: g-proteobacteria)]
MSHSASYGEEAQRRQAPQGPAKKRTNLCYGALVALALMLAGCATLDELGLNPRATTADEQLVLLGQLIEAEPGELDAIGARLEAEAGGTPRTPVDSLRYALWQATPNHEGHAPEAARERLNRLLADGRPPPELEALVRIELRHLRLLDERAQLTQDNQRLSAANRERQARIEALQEQIQALTTLERRMGSGGNGEDSED